MLKSNHPEGAYAAADDALAQAPGKAESLVASGRALFRKGQFQKAEKAWLDAIAIDPTNASALRGLARIRALVAKYKTAQAYTSMAYRLAPDDPDLIVAHADSLRVPEREAALQRALAIYDPDSREAKALRARFSSMEAIGDVKMGKLLSGYHPYEMKLMELHDGPKRIRGLALRVSFNGEHAATLMLDTGASGISLAPHLAEKFGLRQVGDQAGEVHGIGNGAARKGFHFVASSVRVGDLEFQDYPLAVFDSAKSPDFDGLIGANVFVRFLVTIDFPNRVLSLAPFEDATPEKQDVEGPRDASPLPPGLFRVYRIGHMLLVPSFINDDPVPHLFLIDSGSSSNFVDPEAAQNSTNTSSDGRMRVKGVQGTVKDVSRADEATLVFAGFRQRNPGLLAISMKGQSDDIGTAMDGILGLTVLANLKMTIDYRDAGVRFEYQPR